VEWRPWSDGVFDGKGKLILVDLSPLWCHGCHLYDDLLFSNKALAAFIHENFETVRVDPDARPDIAGRLDLGGWPTLCVLTPDGDVVGGKAYAPPEVEAFLRTVVTRWEAAGDSVRIALAGARAQRVSQQPFLREPADIDETALTRVLDAMPSYFDREYGGFRLPNNMPGKLASPELLRRFLTEMAVDPDRDGQLRPFVRRTLDAMARGALRDHLLGGFFRSIRDRAWSLPHFEKLLDIQADFVELYLDAAVHFQDDHYRQIARETIEFAFEFLSNPDGITFANSVDSDLGPGDDGSFYTWSVAAVDSILSPEEAGVVKFYFGIAPSGEVPTRPNQNTLFASYTIEEAATRRQLPPGQFVAVLEQAKARLRAYRLQGPRPRVDDTAYSGANLRFATALLRAATHLAEPRYRERALAILDLFCVQNLQPDGVPHVYDGRQARGPMLLANQVAALGAWVQAFEDEPNPVFLQHAVALRQTIASTYRNEATGAYWDVPTVASGPGVLQLKLRPMVANVHLAEALLDLHAQTGDATHRDAAREILEAFSFSYARSGFDAVTYAAAVSRLVTALNTQSS
jgi:uncharacterized protein YyaL (SSP411 family)